MPQQHTCQGICGFIGLGEWRGLCRAGEFYCPEEATTPLLVLNEAEHRIASHLGSPMERQEFHQECTAHHRAAGILHKLAASIHRAAGGQKVIDHQNPGPRVDAVDVDLQGGRSRIPDRRYGKES